MDKNTSRMIHLLTIPDVSPSPDSGSSGVKTEFMIGRGHESEVRINDISVSRCHALVKFKKDDGFYIEDNQSKFGTIVMLKEGLPLQVNHTVAVQVGRTVVSFTARAIEIPVATA